ncbi:urease accessory protein UreE [Myroides sp. LJL119]
MSNIIEIQQVEKTKDPLASNIAGDIFLIEWFESEKVFFQRHTLQGKEIQLQKSENGHWQSGDLLYANGHLIATIQIKACLCILFEGYNCDELVDFSYYIGNRHLPLYVANNGKGLLVAYDGNLLEQLKNKFEQKVTLVQQVLHPALLLKEQTL